MDASEASLLSLFTALLMGTSADGPGGLLAGRHLTREEEQFIFYQFNI